MKLLGTTLTGSQADRQGPQSFALDAKAGHCYRVYGRGAEGIRDLHLLLEDSAGVALGEDSTESGTAVLLEDGAACFRVDDKARVIVSVGMGAGTYAVQIWSD
jgi:hypothetical protein